MRKNQNKSAWRTSIKVPSLSSERLSLKLCYLVYLNLDVKKYEATKSKPKMKLGWIHLYYQKCWKGNESMYISLVIKPSIPKQ